MEHPRESMSPGRLLLRRIPSSTGRSTRASEHLGNFEPQATVVTIGDGHEEDYDSGHTVDLLPWRIVRACTGRRQDAV